MPKKPLRFLYTGIRVRNLERSIRFYRALGFRIKFRGKMEHGGEFVHLTQPRSKLRIELNYYPKGNRFYTPFRPGSEFDHFGFYSEDPDGWLRAMRRAGGKEAIPTWTEGDQRIGYVNDPDGATLEVFGPKKKPRRRRKS